MGFQNVTKSSPCNYLLIWQMGNILLTLNPSLHVCYCWFLTFFIFFFIPAVTEIKVFFTIWEQRSELLFSDIAINLAFKETPEGTIYTHSSWHPPLQRSITLYLMQAHASLAPRKGVPSFLLHPGIHFSSQMSQSFATWQTVQAHLSGWLI